MYNKVMDIFPKDGVYYFDDGECRNLRAEVKNTTTQLKIKLLDEPPMFPDARLESSMYKRPNRTLVYAKPKKMPNGLYKHQTKHRIEIWPDGDFTLYANREGVPTWFKCRCDKI